MRSVFVSVPASSGNLGPGFDVLAAALDLRLELEASVVPRAKASFQIVGQGRDSLPGGKGNLIRRILDGHLPGRALKVRVVSAIPIASGLGSSGAARLAAHAAGLRLAGSKDNAKALALAAGSEGHPDNVAASFYGGMTAVLCQEPLDVFKWKLPPELKAVVCVPMYRLSTQTAREALPEEVPIGDAVFNMSRALAWVAALQSRQWGRLRNATQDALHQPYRQSLVPGMRRVIEAASEAGAYGACLSGAGPSVLAVCGAGIDLERVGRAMVRAFKRENINALARILNFDNRGLELETS